MLRRWSQGSAFFCLWVCLLALLVSCQMSPTKTYQSESYDTSTLSQALRSPIPVGPDTVILDARSPFEFAMAHLPGAKNLSWTDFSDSRGPYPGRLKTQLRSQVRRLSLLGIGPDTPVVVVGKGRGGKGEEGRLGWTLLYLGVKNVFVAQVDALGLRYSNLVQPPPKRNKNIWKATKKPQLLAGLPEVLDSVRGKKNETVHIIDVRGKKEYFEKIRNTKFSTEDLRAVHIEWKEFFNSKGRPRMKIRRRLKSIGILPQHRVILISNDGLRSGAVTYALLSLGYSKAANYAGGYSELRNKRAD